MKNIYCANREEAEKTIINRFKGQEGWTVIPHDNPMEAIEGYSVFRAEDVEGNVILTSTVDSDVEVIDHSFHFTWYEAGKKLHPQVAIVDPAALLSMVKSNDKLLSCDDPVKNLIGFIFHDLKNGISIIRRTPAPDIKFQPDSIKEPLLKAMAEARKRRESLKRRLEDAAALNQAIK